MLLERRLQCWEQEQGREGGRKTKGWERESPSSGFGWIRRVFQCLTGGQGNFTHACWLLTLAHGAGTVLQHITISIWHCLLCLMPTHTNTRLCAHNSWPYKPTTGTMGIVYCLLAKPRPGMSPRQSREQSCEGSVSLKFSFKGCHHYIMCLNI